MAPITVKGTAAAEGYTQDAQVFFMDTRVSLLSFPKYLHSRAHSKPTCSKFLTITDKWRLLLKRVPTLLGTIVNSAALYGAL